MAQKPETSLQAYRSLDPTKLSETHRKILNALSQLGEATFEDIAEFLHVEKSTIWKRLSELAKQDLIYRPGIKKALRSGRAAFCWKLVDQFAPNIQASEKALKGHSIAHYSRNMLDIAKNMPTTLSTSRLS